jgi:hypothetical protein
VNKDRAIRHIRSQVTSKKHTNLFKALVKIFEDDMLEKVELHGLKDALEEGVHQLPDKTQLVFRLNRFEGKSISEIADKLHLSEKAIKYHLSKSIKELRLHLRHFLVSCLLMILFYEKEVLCHAMPSFLPSLSTVNCIYRLHITIAIRHFSQSSSSHIAWASTELRF